MAKDEAGRKRRTKKDKKAGRDHDGALGLSSDNQAVGAETSQEPIATLTETVEPAQSSERQAQSVADEFSAWYLRRVTMELQDDLDKVRTASDFKDSSLPILIDALKQGESLFSEADKARIMGREQ